MATKKKTVKKTATKKKAVKKTVKKAATKRKPATKRKVKANTKTKAKARKPRAVSKWPRGYKVTNVERELTVAGETELYFLVEVSGPKMDKARYFVDEDSAAIYIAKNEALVLQEKALAGKTHGGMLGRGIMKETADLKALADMPEISTELPEDRAVAKNTEDTDK